MNASADVMAMANIEVDLSTIPVGKGFAVLFANCLRLICALQV
jgi:hypothetical protein